MQESACNAINVCSIPGLGKSPGRGHGNPIQYSCQENLMDRRAWQATVRGFKKSWTWLSTPQKCLTFPIPDFSGLCFPLLLVQYETYAEQSTADIPTGGQNIVNFSESVEMWGLRHLFILFSDSTSLSLQANFNSDSAHFYYITKYSFPILSRDWSLTLLSHISSWSVDRYSSVITVVFDMTFLLPEILRSQNICIICDAGFCY